MQGDGWGIVQLTVSSRQYAVGKGQMVRGERYEVGGMRSEEFTSEYYLNVTGCPDGIDFVFHPSEIGFTFHPSGIIGSTLKDKFHFPTGHAG